MIHKPAHKNYSSSAPLRALREHSSSSALATIFYLLKRGRSLTFKNNTNDSTEQTSESQNIGKYPLAFTIHPASMGENSRNMP